MTEIKRLTDDDIAWLKSGWAKDHECGGGLYITAIADDGSIEIFVRAIEDKVIRNALEAAAGVAKSLAERDASIRDRCVQRGNIAAAREFNMASEAAAEVNDEIRALIPKE